MIGLDNASTLMKLDKASLDSSLYPGIMVLDNQLRAKVDGGSTYVHYGPQIPIPKPHTQRLSPLTPHP
jgi:hypothetical protein